MNILTSLFKLFFMRIKAEDLPHSETASIVVVGVSTVLYLFFFSLFDVFSQPVLYALATAIPPLLVLLLALQMLNKAGRFMQTVLAIYGVQLVGIIIIGLSVPIGLVVLVFFPIVFWIAFLQIIILRDATETNVFAVVLIYLAMQLASASPGMLFPSFSAELEQLQKNLVEMTEQQLGEQQADPALP